LIRYYVISATLQRGSDAILDYDHGGRWKSTVRNGSSPTERISGEREVPVVAESTLRAAENLAKYAKREAPVRYGFISRERADDMAPPMIRLLRGDKGGAGGDVRLRLQLSILWAVRDDPTLSFPARSWASLLGLPEPETKGARRVKTALRWMDAAKLIRLESAPGRDAVVHVLEDTGSGDRYQMPGAVYAKLKSNASLANPHRYIRLPKQLWTNGWLSVLSGPAIVMFLVLWLESGRAVHEQAPWVWVSPSMAEKRYALSEETRLKGARELTRLGLVQTSTRAVPAEAFEYRRGRNSHMIDTVTLLNARPRSLRIQGLLQ
jgi:hypothetical protein